MHSHSNISLLCVTQLKINYKSLVWINKSNYFNIFTDVITHKVHLAPQQNATI